MSILAQRLKQARLEKELAQWELSDLSGVARYTISKCERDLTEPHFATIVLLAKSLDVSLDWLSGLSDERGDKR